MEHDRLVVGRVDRLQAELVRVGVLVGAGVALQVEEVVEVRRAVGEGVLVERALDGVLDVLRRDDGAVLELDALADLVGPGLGAVTGHAEGLGQVGNELGTRCARRRLEHHERAAVVADEVPRVAVVGVRGVERVPVAAVRHVQRAALVGGRVEDLADARVETGRRDAAARAAGPPAWRPRTEPELAGPFVLPLLPQAG